MIFAAKQCSTTAETCRQAALWWLFEATVRTGSDRDKLIGFAVATWADAAVIDRRPSNAS